MGSGIHNTGKPNKLSPVMAVCKNRFHNGIMTYMLQFGLGAIGRIFVAWVVFVKAIFSCLNLKPDDDFYLTTWLSFFNKTGHGLTDIVFA